MLLDGANALLAKVSGKNQIKPADCTASTLRTRSPTVAPIQEKAKLKIKSRPIAATQPVAPPSFGQYGGSAVYHAMLFRPNLHACLAKSRG